MTVIAVIGDCTTTTCVALAAGWAVDDVLVLEADPSGGSLAGWLDTPSSPSLATIVANTGVRESSDGAVLSTVSAMTQRSTSGVRFVAAPLRTLAARRAIEEATAFVVPALGVSDVVTLADLGRRDPTNLPTDIVAAAAATLVVHRQHAASPAAEAVRLERLIELVEHLAAHARTVMIAVVGSDPFDPAEIAQHVEASVPGAVGEVVTLADDPLAAAVLAGRAGVSANRLRRLPLMRSAATVASRLALGSRTAPASPGAPW
jgi:MinD-like ATPase involved in chromosome partitioning or flagellar assembly